MSEIHALAGPYVLNAVTEDERAAFEDHLTRCVDCRAEVAELTETAARLAEGAWSPPPPRLKRAVLAEVAQTRQARPAPVHRPDRQAPARRRRLSFALAAAVAAVVATGGTVWAVQQSRLDDERARLAAVEAQQARMQSIVTAPDVVVRDGAVDGGGRVTVVMSPSRAAGIVVLADAPTPAPDQAYQLWLIHGSVADPGAVLTPGSGDGTYLIDGLRGIDQLGVTLEPATGSPVPTLPVVARVQMS